MVSEEVKKKDKVLRQMAYDYQMMFGYEKDFVTGIAWKIAQLHNDTENYLEYKEELRI